MSNDTQATPGSSHARYINLQTVTAGIHLRVSRIAKAPLFASLQDATHQCLTVMATTPDAIKRGAGARGELFINTNLFMLQLGEPERLLAWLETDARTATEAQP